MVALPISIYLQRFVQYVSYFLGIVMLLSHDSELVVPGERRDIYQSTQKFQEIQLMEINHTLVIASTRHILEYAFRSLLPGCL